MNTFGGIGASKSKSGFRHSLASFLLAVVLGTSGCAVNGDSLSQLAESEKLVTNSVASVAKPEGIEQTDAEIIKTAVADANVSSPIKPLAWTNPETGSSGTIVAIEKFQGKHGQRCRGFKTSVDTFMGIAFYNGEACQTSPREWVLSWFKTAE